MSFKTWLLNKLVKYAISQGGKKKVQEVQKGIPNEKSNSTMPDVSIIWKVDEKGNCNCPHHPKKEVKEKRAVKKQTKKRIR